mgnify:CR=1 FL=1
MALSNREVEYLNNKISTSLSPQDFIEKVRREVTVWIQAKPDKKRAEAVVLASKRLLFGYPLLETAKGMGLEGSINSVRDLHIRGLTGISIAVHNISLKYKGENEIAPMDIVDALYEHLTYLDLAPTPTEAIEKFCKKYELPAEAEAELIMLLDLFPLGTSVINKDEQKAKNAKQAAARAEKRALKAAEEARKRSEDEMSLEEATALRLQAEEHAAQVKLTNPQDMTARSHAARAVVQARALELKIMDREAMKI